jgi:hypothetical protein
LVVVLGGLARAWMNQREQPAPPSSPSALLTQPLRPGSQARAAVQKDTLSALPPGEVFDEVALRKMATRLARLHRVDEHLVLTVIEKESQFDAFAVSPRGAMGLMQLMPETAARLGVKNAFDPVQNVDGGVRYLKELLGQYNGDGRLALAAYETTEGLAESGTPIPTNPTDAQQESKSSDRETNTKAPRTGASEGGPDVGEKPSRPSVSAVAFDSLTAAERQSIEAACSTAKYTEGPASYNHCLQQYLARLSSGPRRPDLSKLSAPELQSIEAACSTAKYTEGPASYNRCLQQHLTQLSLGPRRPDLSGLSAPEFQSIEAACSTAKYTEGPASYNQCLWNQLRMLSDGSK